jgi:hypothetical protein
VSSVADAEAIADHWVNYYVRRILDKKDTVTIVDGEPGEGKSNFTLWLAARIRYRLGLELGLTRTLDLQNDIVYRLTTLIHRVYQSSRENPSVVIADEGVLVGAQGSSGLTDSGKLLDRVLSIGRIKGCTLFVLHPNVWGLASFVRNRRAKVFMHVECRGLTTAFTLKSALDFVPPRQLPFTKARPPWAKIPWPSLETDPVWAPYELGKLETVNQTLVDSEIEAAKIEVKAGLRIPGTWATEYWKKGRSGRARGQTPADYNREQSRNRMRNLRASRRANGPNTTAPLHRTRARARA